MSRETVMCQVCGMEVPPRSQAEVSGKRKVRYLYVEADEDHIALQYKEKKGDIRRFKGHAGNGQTVKLVYVHEGYEDGGKDEKRKKLKNVAYFGGLYRGKDSSTEGHISHVLSARMSSRPMGWSRPGADSLSHIRVYWKNGGDMLELVQHQKEEKAEERQEEEKYFSASEILSWEKKHSKANGKYIEALQARISSQTSGRILFHNAIASVC